MSRLNEFRAQTEDLNPVPRSSPSAPTLGLLLAPIKDLTALHPDVQLFGPLGSSKWVRSLHLGFFLDSAHVPVEQISQDVLLMNKSKVSFTACFPCCARRKDC